MEEAFRPTPEQYVDYIPTLNVEGAKVIAAASIVTAVELRVYGSILILSITGMQEYSQAFGASARPAHVDIAGAKATTVLNMRRSTRRLAEWLGAERVGARPEDFAGQIKSLLSGGVAIFADEAQSQFVGAAAFSGGSPEQDEYICLRGVYMAGLFSDIPLEESQERLKPKEL